MKLTDDDCAKLAEINETTDHPRNELELIHLITSYWHDLDRAERTPRDYMYLHLGMLAGVASKLYTALHPRIH